jgi:cardiolipin synthase
MMLVAEGTFRKAIPGTDETVFSLLRLIPALIILSREILVSGLREFLAGTRVSVPVTAVAKFKTAVQMIAIGAMILTPLIGRYYLDLPGTTYSFIVVAHFLVWVAAALTVYTGVIYFKNGMRHLRPGFTPDAREQPIKGPETV